MRDTMPWERQKGESHQAFEAFHEYCLMGSTRSIRKVAEKLGKSQQLLSRWSSKWDWVNRSREYDNELVRNETEEAKKEIAEMRKRQIEMGKYFQAKGVAAIKEKVEKQEKLSYETLRDLINLVTNGVSIETKARIDTLYSLKADSGKDEEISGITEERRQELDDFFYSE